MNLFTYLLAKKGKNSLLHGDLFSYLLGKGTSQTQTISGTTIYIPDAKAERIVSLIMTKESTQDGEPSPENPQEVKTVKGYRNLFDKDTIEWERNNVSTYEMSNINTNTTRIRTSSFSIQGGKTYTISGIPNGITLAAVRTYAIPSGESLGSATKTANTFTLNNNINYIHLLFGGENFTDATNELMKNADIQIIEGTTIKPYVPYGNNYIAVNISDGTNTNQVPLPLNGNEIAGIGDYKDELIVDKNGHCWLNKKINKSILNENEDWTMTTAQPSIETLKAYQLINHVPTRLLGEIPLLSTHFKVLGYSSGGSSPIVNAQNEGIIINRIQDRLYFISKIQDLTSFKDFIENNQVELYYVLENSQLIDLNTTVDIRLFKGVNNITNSEDCNMSLTYENV